MHTHIYKPDHATPLLKILQWILILIRVKANVLTMTHTAVQDLAPTASELFCSILSVDFSHLATLAPLLFLKLTVYPFALAVSSALKDVRRRPSQCLPPDRQLTPTPPASLCSDLCFLVRSILTSPCNTTTWTFTPAISDSSYLACLSVYHNTTF